jgi:transmembrane sensor
MLGGRYNVLTIELSEQVLREASEWFARRNAGDATAEDHKRLDIWLAARPDNRRAYDFVTETCAIAATVHQRTPVPHGSASRRPIGRWITAGSAVALAATLIAAIGTIALAPPTTGHYTTAVGEIRTVALDDGSALTLNGATALDITFTRDRRDLELKSGEFFVTVGKDPARPFRVRAGGRTIEDIGTAFDVDMNGQTVDVAVGEGTIKISTPITSSTGDAVVLSKGQAVTYAADRILSTTRTVASQQIGTWRVGILSYDQVPLEWLVADLNRQFDGGIAVSDPQLAAMPITLTLKLHDRDTTVGTLEKLLPVHAVASGTGAIELVRANPEVR